MSPDPADHQLLARLLRERSLQRGEFVLASGRRSPYYVDCRRTTMHALGMALIGRLGLAALREAGWKVGAVGGLTLGADPVAYAIAMASNSAPPPIHAFSVRRDRKQHGTGRRIEGCLEPGAAVAVVEDVITSGTSALEAVAVVREAGGTVEGVLAVVDRREGGSEAIAAAGIPVLSLLDMSALLEASE